MATKEKQDSEVDEFATQAFLGMGFEQPFSHRLVKVYKAMKHCHDKLSPGRLSSEGFAACAVISNMTVELKPDKKPPEGE